jgi:NADP-dependent 3-hydroxy acid dehydrogenase YdfG
MNKTVLITGSSSGIGKTTAHYFLERGWNVIATMRSPEKEIELNKHPNCLVTRLDVNDEKSIEMAIDQGLKRFQKIDVLVNNAGFGLMGVLEGMCMEQIKKQFDTNVFGLLLVSQKILPHFRLQKNGTIINISSVAGRVAFPLFSLYHGTKWAVEGISESLQYELAAFNIKVKCVEPVAIKTFFFYLKFYNNKNTTPDAYLKFAHYMLNKTNQAGSLGKLPIAVAKVIYRAANDQSFKLRYPVGLDIKFFLFMRKIMPTSLFRKLVQFSLRLS